MATEEIKFKIINDYFISISSSSQEIEMLENATLDGCSCKENESESLLEWIEKNDNILSPLMKKYLVDIHEIMEKLDLSYEIIETLEIIRNKSLTLAFEIIPQKLSNSIFKLPE